MIGAGRHVDDYTGTLAIGDPGRAATELSAGRPPAAAGSADHEISACSLPGIEVRAASVRGLLHRYRDEPRQDRYSIAEDTDASVLIVSVCDGVGDLPLSHDAAGFVAKAMPGEFVTRGGWAPAIAEVNERLARFAAQAMDGDRPHRGMATTFVGAAIPLVAQGRTASIAWTDDSSVWLLAAGAWTKLTVDRQPTNGPLHDTRVRALPHREPRFRTAEVPVERGALFVMTDGVGVPLESSGEVRDTLARWWEAPPEPFTFARQVGFARRTHIDDRTVVGVWFGWESGRRP